ncbi:thylakoid lumenal 17.4 kDa protein, chloroplastic isoform X1 [Vigna unguiculata]|uniref:Pentapeptide repeat n=1 Tax=Vigna unguiculata TaxID=3917 RepID=A0A4D6NSS3_VIGUN|nr:thylakoid lumenal 17.4 kDa protein, chloroplastic isoform X1 [Vigna unguiculata]QCE15559.1 Pentapeptide repeat [Vigna unguiculata]
MAERYVEVPSSKTEVKSEKKTTMANVSIPLPRNGFCIPNYATKRPSFTPPFTISCSGVAELDGSHQNKGGLFSFNGMKGVACGILAACAVTSSAFPVPAATQRLPPLSTEPNRCERAFIGNTIGQANGVYDKPLDLRQCDFTNEKSNLKGKSLSAALMSDAKFDGADMSEVIMSKAYAAGASFKGVDFSNAVLDRVNFEKADLEGAVFRNTVLSGSTFDEAKLDKAVFEDTIIGYIDLQKLCTNKSIGDEGRAELGCR